MPSFRTGKVVRLLEERTGLQRAEVDLGDGPERAYVLTQLTGRVDIGDPVVVNTTAVELGLGTGGWHVVHWNLGRDEWNEKGPGHIIKGRYTSLQADVGSTEEHLEALAEAESIDGMPVVAAALHSQVPAVAVAVRAARPDARIAYVMTDGAGLPLALSDLVATLRDRDLIDATVTYGHAFGGDYEAVSVFSALVVARQVAGADVAIVAMGPGIVGTNTRLGFSGLEVGPVLDAAVALGGVPVACLRVSFADPRSRHLGLSHHSATALRLATRSRVIVPVPCVGGTEEARVRADLGLAGIDARHDVVDVDPPDVLGLFAHHELRIVSMGRPAADDPVMFQAAAAAGSVAAEHIPARELPAMSERLERLINLTATLLETRRPLTLEELADRLEPGYPGELAARRRQFERDKETLRELGVPITVEAVDALGGEQGYRIRPEDYYLPDPDLDAAERAALHLAVTAVEVGGFDPLDALRKLGGAEGEGAGRAVATFELTPHLGDCFDGVTRRRVLTFRYRDEDRRLEPYGILHRFGHWYVVGRDLDRDGPRAFRVDRFDGPPRLGDPDAFTAPPDVDPTDYLSSDPLTYGDDQPVRARVLVDATRASLVHGTLGDAAVVEQRDDGAIVVALDVVNRDAFRTFVLDLLDHAEVLDPPELRAEVVDWLTVLAADGGAR